MKRHLQPVPKTQPHLSIEEEAIFIDEYNQSDAELNELGAAANRLIVTDEILVDAQSAIQQTWNAGDVDQSLVGAVADMAVAGTDADPEVFAGPTEGLSAESFGSAIKNAALRIWEAIKAAIEKIWMAIKKFFSNIAEFFTGNKRKEEEARAKQLEEEALRKLNEEERRRIGEEYRKKVQANQAHYDAGFTVYKGRIDRLSIGDGKILPAAKLIAKLRETTDFFERAIPIVIDHTLEQSKILLDTVNDVAKAPGDIEAILERMAPSYLDVEKRLYDKVIPSNGSHTELLGGLRYIASDRNMGSVFELNKTYLTTTSASSLSPPKEAKVQAASINQGAEICKLSKSWRKKMDDPALKRQIDQLDNLAETLKKTYDKVVVMPVRPINPHHRSIAASVHGVLVDEVKENDDRRIKCQKVLAQLISSLTWRVKNMVMNPAREVGTTVHEVLCYELQSGLHRIEMVKQGYADVYKREGDLH